MTIIKKRIFLLIIVFPWILSGCETMRNPFISSPVAGYSQDRTMTVSGEPYLVQGSTVTGKSENEQMYGAIQEGLSREEMVIELVDMQKKLKEEERKGEALKAEMKEVRKQFGQEIFHLQNKLSEAQKEKEDFKTKAMEARLKLVKTDQTLDRMLKDILEKKAMMDSTYPIYYEVKRGDSLWKISAKRKIYNDPFKWIELYTANKEKLDDPDFVLPGQVLRIPRYFEYLYGMPEMGAPGLPYEDPEEDEEEDIEDY